MKNCLETPPTLKINSTLYKDRTMPVHVRLEQRIVWNLLLVLWTNGFDCYSVNDGEVDTRVKGMKAAMELLFNLDDAYLYLTHKSGERNAQNKPRTVWIRFVFGNELDVISDYSATNWHGFEDLMDKFNPEDYA